MEYKKKMPTIGIINPWPGDMSAESEVLSRMKRAAEENGICFVMLDNFGHILDDEQKMTEEFVDAHTLDFVITTHYETPKVLDAFYYHTVWNPPEIPMNLGDYAGRISGNYIMNDDYLIYDTGGMTDHLKSMLMNCPRTLEGASMLTASFPASAVLSPKLDNPTMFYCGMNWEKVVHGTNRHEGLFRLLDNSGKVKFFGPDKVKAWGGLRPWEGYKCYQYPIPFDGFSILDEINKCGICLVLSSDIHRRAGAATNRTYEACAAGAVIISDDNPFMLEHFGDAALFITYNRNDPQDTYKQIMEKYTWIEAHPEEALKLARRAQEIFLEKFSLDKQLKDIIRNHPKRVAQIKKDLYATNEDKKVLVTYVLNTQKEKKAQELLKSVFANIRNQDYSNILCAIAADPLIYPEACRFAEEFGVNAEVVQMPLFDKKMVRCMTDGQAIRALQKQFDHAFYMNTTAEELWFTDHVSTLVRTLEDSSVYGAYSAGIHEDIYGYRRMNFYGTLNSEHLFYIRQPMYPLKAGQFLFKKEAHDLVPDYLFNCIDGKEHLLYTDILIYKQEKKVRFTKRASFCFTQEDRDSRAQVLDIPKQLRFIQDLIHYEVNELMIQAIPEIPESVLRSANKLPFKLRIKEFFKRNAPKFLYEPMRLFWIKYIK